MEKYKPIPWAPQYGITVNGECIAFKTGHILQPVRKYGHVVAEYQLTNNGKKNRYIISRLIKDAWGSCHKRITDAMAKQLLMAAAPDAVLPAEKSQEIVAVKSGYRLHKEQERHNKLVEIAAKAPDELWKSLEFLPAGASSWDDPIMDPMSAGFPLVTFSVQNHAGVSA